MEIETQHGLARAEVLPGDGDGVLVLGHGAGGGTHAPDLRAAGAVARGLGWSVVFVDQPYRVAGRRAPAPAAQLDVAWLAVLAALREKGVIGSGPLVVGGRSSGARVACRTADDGAATGVVCLAFPLHPPGRANDPTKSRLPELDAVRVPVLIVQGESDPFGMPPEDDNRRIVRLRGNHSLRSDMPGLRSAVEAWLPTL
ncbi:alpha/beta family hydrolase [Pseudactinotalea sp.]|uniref:alpha/beta hydrolase family protein n=1 Tax=Pseudactinotalea sp. TaxID=1926260 RepID=UPI003B3AE555